MRAAIYNPYLDTLGGGERYTMAFANALIKKGYTVDVQWQSEDIKIALEKRFGVYLEGINFIKDVKKGDGYDMIFWVADGSIPLLQARHNILHFQFPFKDVNGKSLLNKMKLYRIEKIICNSNFTKNIIDQEYGVKSIVIYPPVDVEKIKPKKKENIIIYVGRFSQLTQIKGQDILIDIFSKFTKEKPDWRLILAGGSEIGADIYLQKLYRLIKDKRVEIIENPSFNQIKDLYGRAKIFWSAAGYGIDEFKNPKQVEHFGITPIESMAAGCVPLLYGAGGHKEIIVNAENGYLWSQKNELIKKTIFLINNQKALREISIKARRSSSNFSYEQFNKAVSEII